MMLLLNHTFADGSRGDTDGDSYSLFGPSFLASDNTSTVQPCSGSTYTIGGGAIEEDAPRRETQVQWILKRMTRKATMEAPFQKEGQIRKKKKYAKRQKLSHPDLS